MSLPVKDCRKRRNLLLAKRLRGALACGARGTWLITDAVDDAGPRTVHTRLRRSAPSISRLPKTLEPEYAIFMRCFLSRMHATSPRIADVERGLPKMVIQAVERHPLETQLAGWIRNACSS